MHLYDVPAPAKLNLFLHVVGRRSDGYHQLQTVFRFIDLADTLQFERRNDGRIVYEGAVTGLRPEDDLIYRAALMLQRATGSSYGAHIACAKRIPLGGGLGGGSSNAASTLIALNRLWETKLDRSQLLKLAIRLGADVPVFVFGASAFAEGVGEQLSQIELPERGYLVVRPGRHVSTADVFADPYLTRDTKSIRISVFTDWLSEQKANLGSAQNLFGRNDLEPIVCEKHKTVKDALAFLTGQGLQARMTGSGACLFVQFANFEQALLNQQRIIGKITDCGDASSVIEAVWACRGLDSHPLRHWTKG